MSKKMSFYTLLVLLFVNMLGLAFNCRTVKASEAIYIMSDGTIVPGTAPISTIDQVIYVLEDNVTTTDGWDGIVVLKDDIIIDGNGFWVGPLGLDKRGIDLSHRINVTITNTTFFFCQSIHLNKTSYAEISNNNFTLATGVHLVDSANNTILSNDFGNRTSEAEEGAMVVLDNSTENSIINNHFTQSAGVSIDNSNKTTISNNTMIAVTAFYGGVKLERGSKENTIYNNTIIAIPDRYGGIFILDGSNNNNVTQNTIANKQDGEGVVISSSQGNTVSSNNITSNQYGIMVEYSDGNTISSNNIRSNQYGIYVVDSSDNYIYHNNFIDNTNQVYNENSINNWDNGYPSGGNYWNDHFGVDYYIGPNQNQPGRDGIVDERPGYIIDLDNTDRYPFMDMCPSTVTIYTLTISKNAGTTNPSTGTHSFKEGTLVFVYAIDSSNLIHYYWELDGSYAGRYMIMVTMNSDHALHAVFRPRRMGHGATIFALMC